MRDPCHSLPRFFDGELTASEADRYREHLVTCEKCQNGLEELLQIDAAAVSHLVLQRPRPAVRLAMVTPGGAAKAAVPPRPGRRPRWTLWTGGGLALAASLTLVVSYALPPSVPDELWQPGGAEGRLAEARSSYPRAAPYQKLAQRPLGGSGDGPPAQLYQSLAKLGDDHMAIASALLVRGDPSEVKKALQHLRSISSPPSPDHDAERAMAYLVRADREQADHEEALRYAERALAEDPRHGPALWNKALALQRLGLTMLAATTFDQVAKLQEPGWATEASSKADALRKQAGRRRRSWRDAKAEAEALVRSGTSLSAEAAGAPISRKLFSVAVRTRTSAQEARALLPLAAQLDGASGGTSLRDYVQWVAGRSFAVRAPLVDAYRRLREGARGAEAAALARELWSSGEDDLAVVALDQSPEAPGEEDLRRLLERARALKDPSFEVIARLRRAAVLEFSDLDSARKEVEEAIRTAGGARLDYGLLEARIKLITVLLRGSELEQAVAQAHQAWADAERASEWGMQRQILYQMAQLARLRDDYPVAKAYLEELIERTREDNDKKYERSVRSQLAAVEFENLRPALAREQLDAVVATGLPLTTVEVGVLADVARKHPAAMDRQVIDVFRAGLPMKPLGEQALATQAIGRWTLEFNPDEGRRLLRDAIAQAGAVVDPDGDGMRARSFSYTALVMDAAKRQDFSGVLALFGEEAGAPFPEACAVALSVDFERSVAVARGASGQLEGEYHGARTELVGARLDGLVSPRLLAALDGCREVKVVARPPIFGKLGALPNTIPWSYLLLGRPTAGALAGAPPEGTHLVVQSVALSERFRRLDLQIPQPWVVDEPRPAGYLVLEGAEASPSRILAAMRSAADIDIVTHSVINPSSREAFLVTAEAPEGDTLTATQLRDNPLPARPIVTLSACRAAHTAPVLYVPRSLPAALLLAGARAVLAADEEVPEREGPELFDAIRARIREGSSPAVALRDVRQAWRSQGKVRNWAESVLLFE